MPRLTVTGTNIDAPDANALADFYRRLLGWTTRTEEPGWVVIQPGASDQARGGTLSFQTESRYVRPVWPAGPGDQLPHLVQGRRPVQGGGLVGVVAGPVDLRVLAHVASAKRHSIVAP